MGRGVTGSGDEMWRREGGEGVGGSRREEWEG